MLHTLLTTALRYYLHQLSKTILNKAVVFTKYVRKRSVLLYRLPTQDPRSPIMHWKSPLGAYEFLDSSQWVRWLTRNAAANVRTQGIQARLAVLLHDHAAPSFVEASSDKRELPLLINIWTPGFAITQSQREATDSFTPWWSQQDGRGL